MDNRHPSPNPGRYATNLVERSLQYLSYIFVNTPVYGIGVLARAFKRRPLRAEDFRRQHIRSILVVRVDGLGDIVLMSSFIRALRAGFPDAWITLVVDQKVLRFVEMCPWVNETVGMDERGSKYKRLFVGWLRAWRTAARLRRDYDLAINPRWDVDSRAATLLGYYSLASFHVGFSERVNANKRRINRGSDRMFSHFIDATPGPLHEEDRNNEVLKFLGLQQSRTAPELWLGEDDVEWAEKAIAPQRTGSGGRLVCFGIGGLEAKRLWPAQRFGNVAAWLREKFGASIIVIGGEEDRVAALEMAARIPDTPIMNFAGACSMRRSAALLRHCDLFVGTDSGPMHMAVAAGVPVVEIACHPVNGSVGHVNSPDRYKPLHVPARVLQPRKRRSPCSDGCEASVPHCILEIEVGDVQNAITDLVAEVVNTQKIQVEAF